MEDIKIYYIPYLKRKDRNTFQETDDLKDKRILFFLHVIYSNQNDGYVFISDSYSQSILARDNRSKRMEVIKDYVDIVKIKNKYGRYSSFYRLKDGYNLKEVKAGIDKFTFAFYRKVKKTQKKLFKSNKTNKYRKYLHSYKWMKIKNRIKRERKTCEKCGSNNMLEIHHIHYDNIFNEKDEDLMLLCKKCHAKEHKKIIT